MQKKEYQIMFNFEDNYWWYVGLHELIKSFIDKYSEGVIDKKIFDAGCGTGKMLKLLNNYSYKEGVDFSEDAIFYSKKRGLKNVRIENLNDWKHRENNFDFVISADVICSIGIKNDIKIIENCMKSLKKGGVLILNLPALEILRRNHDKAVHIAKRYNKNILIKELKNKGYKINYATYRLPILFFVILFKKNIEKITNNKKGESDLKTISNWLNILLLKLIRLENFFLIKGFKIPFGSSLFVVVEK